MNFYGIEVLNARITCVEYDNEELRKENQELKKENQELKKENIELRKRIAILEFDKIKNARIKLKINKIKFNA